MVGEEVAASFSVSRACVLTGVPASDNPPNPWYPERKAGFSHPRYKRSSVRISYLLRDKDSMYSARPTPVTIREDTLRSRESCNWKMVLNFTRRSIIITSPPSDSFSLSRLCFVHMATSLPSFLPFSGALDRTNFFRLSIHRFVSSHRSVSYPGRVTSFHCRLGIFHLVTR